MEGSYKSYNLGITWTEFGDQRESDFDLLLDSRPDFTPQERSKLVSLWKRHPANQKQVDDPVGAICKIIGKQMTASEINCLFDNFSSQALLISQGQFRGSVIGLYKRIWTTVKSSTKKSAQHTGYFFDAPLPNAYGQGTTTLQYVHYHNQVFCAKIGGLAADLPHELNVSLRLHDGYRCSTVMRIVDSLELSHNRLALICPYYPATVAIMPPGECTLAMMCNVALCTIASIAAFRRVGLSHNDIKPTNLMLTTTSQLIVLVDFGSAVDFQDEDASRGTSEFWGRDCPPGSRKYDMACLASVLYHLQHGPDRDGMGLQALAKHVQNLQGRTIIDDMILDCIHRADEDVAALFTDWQAKVAGVRQELVEGTVVDRESVWPTPAI